MIRDHAERRTYRKSPGRQYGYQYDPLRTSSQNNSSQTGHVDAAVQSDSWSSQVTPGSPDTPRTTGLLAPRPNPRRTRQLLRQNILASKSKSALLVETEPLDPDIKARHFSPDENQIGIDEDEYEDEDPLEQRLIRPESPRGKTPSRRIADDYAAETYQRGRRRNAPVEYDEYEEDAYADEEIEEQQTRRKKKKKSVSRRKLLLGAIAIGGTAVAAYELAPRIPSALENAGSNIEHQIQDAFNRGVTAGGEAVRKELINSLDNLEGVSLDAAMGAAKLTRTAYDVFVSPVVTLAATVAGDFLQATSLALQTGRGWLNRINYGSATLDALQTVVDSWVKQAHNLPQHWQAATDTDLDGAQAYLRALQQKIRDEQAKLNGQQTTPTASPKPSSTPKH